MVNPRVISACRLAGVIIKKESQYLVFKEQRQIQKWLCLFRFTPIGFWDDYGVLLVP